jgi:hypothetical protein
VFNIFFLLCKKLSLTRLVSSSYMPIKPDRELLNQLMSCAKPFTAIPSSQGKSPDGIPDKKTPLRNHPDKLLERVGDMA